MPPSSNDRISKYLDDFVPDEHQGDDRFLDIITWNIKFFNVRDRRRVEVVTRIVQELNADIFVLQEIEAGSLDEIAQTLNESGTGLYKVVYGQTGRDIRVTFMYDMEWVKATTQIEELFREQPIIPVGSTTKEVFPRLPLHAKFVAYRENVPFDFHLVGVHLKSQRGPNRSVSQRAAAARFLANWLLNETTDEDVIIAGDWNASADKPEWEPFQELEEQERVYFEAWNPGNEGSYLAASGSRTRLDFIVVTSAVEGVRELNEASIADKKASRC